MEDTEKEKKGVRLVLTIDYTPSLEVLKRLDWKPAIGMGLAELTIFSSRTRAEAAQGAALMEQM